MQIAHTRIALDETEERAHSRSSTTQLTLGRLRTFAAAAAEMKQSCLWCLEKCDVRIKAWDARSE